MHFELRIVVTQPCHQDAHTFFFFYSFIDKGKGPQMKAGSQGDKIEQVVWNKAAIKFAS